MSMESSDGSVSAECADLSDHNSAAVQTERVTFESAKVDENIFVLHGSEPAQVPEEDSSVEESKGVSDMAEPSTNISIGDFKESILVHGKTINTDPTTEEMKPVVTEFESLTANLPVDFRDVIPDTPTDARDNDSTAEACESESTSAPEAPDTSTAKTADDESTTEAHNHESTSVDEACGNESATSTPEDHDNKSSTAEACDSKSSTSTEKLGVGSPEVLFPRDIEVDFTPHTYISSYKHLIEGDDVVVETQDLSSGTISFCKTEPVSSTENKFHDLGYKASSGIGQPSDPIILSCPIDVSPKKDVVPLWPSVPAKPNKGSDTSVGTGNPMTECPIRNSGNQPSSSAKLAATSKLSGTTNTKSHSASKQHVFKLDKELRIVLEKFIISEEDDKRSASSGPSILRSVGLTDVSRLTSSNPGIIAQNSTLSDTRSKRAIKRPAKFKDIDMKLGRSMQAVEDTPTYPVKRSSARRNIASVTTQNTSDISVAIQQSIAVRNEPRKRPIKVPAKLQSFRLSSVKLGRPQREVKSATDGKSSNHQSIATRSTKSSSTSRPMSSSRSAVTAKIIPPSSKPSSTSIGKKIAVEKKVGVVKKRGATANDTPTAKKQKMSDLTDSGKDLVLTKSTNILSSPQKILKTEPLSYETLKRKLPGVTQSMYDQMLSQIKNHQAAAASPGTGKDMSKGVIIRLDKLPSLALKSSPDDDIDRDADDGGDDPSPISSPKPDRCTEVEYRPSTSKVNVLSKNKATSADAEKQSALKNMEAEKKEVLRCSVLRCDNAAQTIDAKSNVEFYKFPTSNTSRCLSWLGNIKSSKLNSLTFLELANMYVCADHFMENDYELCATTGEYRLKPDAVPTKFLGVGGRNMYMRIQPSIADHAVITINDIVYPTSVWNEYAKRQITTYTPISKRPSMVKFAEKCLEMLSTVCSVPVTAKMFTDYMKSHTSQPSKSAAPEKKSTQTTSSIDLPDQLSNPIPTNHQDKAPPTNPQEKPVVLHRADKPTDNANLSDHHYTIPTSLDHQDNSAPPDKLADSTSLADNTSPERPTNRETGSKLSPQKINSAAELLNRALSLGPNQYLAEKDLHPNLKLNISQGVEFYPDLTGEIGSRFHVHEVLKLANKLAEVNRRHQTSSKNLKLLRRKYTRAVGKFKALHATAKKLQGALKSQPQPKALAQKLENHLEGAVLDVVKKAIEKRRNSMNWEPATKEFCLQMYRVSQAGYRKLKELLPLPAERLVRKWDNQAEMERLLKAENEPQSSCTVDDKPRYKYNYGTVSKPHTTTDSPNKAATSTPTTIAPPPKRRFILEPEPTKVPRVNQVAVSSVLSCLF